MAGTNYREPDGPEIIEVGNHCSISSAGGDRWAIHNSAGIEVSRVSTKELALKLAKELDETGRISR
jgi:hypothetical protein